MDKDTALKLALEALGTMDVFNPNRMKAITALRQAVAKAEKQDKFCDNNCVWTDHHPDCKLGQPDRQELQAKGEHPAPCARFCEANAFQIEIRNLKAKLENQHPEWYHTKNIHGCDVFYHKAEERSYMFGEITPLYTTPPQRQWVGLTSDNFNDFNPLFKAEEAVRWAEAKLKEKNT